MVFAWYPEKKSENVIQPESISEKGKPKFGLNWVGILFLGVFCVIGLAIFAGHSAEPLYKSLDALTWERIPCIVKESKVIRTRDSDGDLSYRLNILYTYRIKGIEYTSNRYSYAPVASSEPDRAKKLVNRYAAGVQEYCYVNPDQLTEAVLNKDLTFRHLTYLLPLVYIALGLVGIIVTWKSVRKHHRAMLPGVESGYRAGTPTWLPTVTHVPIGNQHGTITLKPHTSTWTQVGALLFFTLFWNGLISVFVWKAVTSWLEGKPEYFLSVFIIPFVLVGLGLLVGVGYTVLKLFNPRVILVMSQPSVRLGESFNLTWRIPRARAIDHMEITVQGREEAQYTRGTDTCTDKEVFRTIPVLSSSFAMEMVGGSRLITIPSDSVPSFKADNNKIIWAIHVEGEIKRWPDINDEYEIPVLPLEHTAMG